MDDWAWKPREPDKKQLPRFFCALKKLVAMAKSEVHIGAIVKEVFDNSGLTVTELARKLHYERSNIYAIFNRKTIDVELLASLSVILNHNFLEDAIRLYELPSSCQPTYSFTIESITPDLAKKMGDTFRKITDNLNNQ